VKIEIAVAPHPALRPGTRYVMKWREGLRGKTTSSIDHEKKGNEN
jgi:hypothetical protein